MRSRSAICILIIAFAGVASAQYQRPAPPPPPPARGLFAPRPMMPQQQKPMRTAAQIINRQAPIKIDQTLLAKVSPDDVHVIVSLGKQRAYLMTGEKIIIDSPISSGRVGHGTPTGSFHVLEKDPDHHSSLYGDFVDGSGRVVRAGVSMHIDSAPSGTHFQGATMKWFMRLTGDGVGMHIGILPGYPASHGCVRMPPDGAKLFYDHVKVGTPVEVQPAG